MDREELQFPSVTAGRRWSGRNEFMPFRRFNQLMKMAEIPAASILSESDVIFQVLRSHREGCPVPETCPMTDKSVDTKIGCFSATLYLSPVLFCTDNGMAEICRDLVTGIAKIGPNSFWQTGLQNDPWPYWKHALRRLHSDPILHEQDIQGGRRHTEKSSFASSAEHDSFMEPGIP